MIARGEEELIYFSATLQARSISEIHSTLELVEAVRGAKTIALVLTETMSKSVYDLIAQYSSGHITLQDPDTMEPIILTPNYERANLLLLATVATVKQLARSGFDIHSHVGLTYQAQPERV